MAPCSENSANRATPSRSSAASIRWTAATPTKCMCPRSPRGAHRSCCCVRHHAPRRGDRRRTLMKRALLLSAATFVSVIGVSLYAQSVAELTYDANADIISLPSYGEVAGVATNSRGQVFVYARTGHAVATLGDERTFYHGGSRLFQFDQAGKFVKEIGQGVYAVNFAQQVRVDPQDNIWIVDAGSNQIVKFDAEGRFVMVLGRKPENIPLRPGPGVSATAADAAFLARGAAPEAG